MSNIYLAGRLDTEIEAKWLSIDPIKIRRALETIGAKLILSERTMIRCNFDFENKETLAGWVRVRDEGDKVTLSYKQLNDRTIHGMKEVNVVVDDFDATCTFLEAIGLKRTSIQETKRESWKLGDTEIEIDTWPWIPTFLEIEATSEEELFRVAALLQLPREEALYGSVEVAYQAIYDVSEEEIDNWEEIRFIDTPNWLVKKARVV